MEVERLGLGVQRLEICILGLWLKGRGVTVEGWWRGVYAITLSMAARG